MTKQTLNKQYVPTEDKNNRFRISLSEILFIICVTILCCGVEFGYDVPASLQVIMEENYGLTNYEYSLFYSLYALPNIFLCLFGGFLIDSVLGIKRSTILYMAIALAGSIFFAMGGFVDLIWLMLIGRLLFGLGAEMGSVVCLNYLTFTKFKNTNMNLVFSISDNFGYLGNIAVYQVSYRLYDSFKKNIPEKQSLQIVLLITSSVFLISAICGVLMIYLKPNDSNSGSLEEEQEPIKQKQDNQPEYKSVLINMKEKLYHTILEFPPIFWLLCLISSCFSNAIFTFESFLQGMLSTQYKLSLDEIGHINIMLNVTKIICSIPLSMIVDRIGRNIIFVTMATVTVFMAHTLLFMSIKPQICLILLGLGYTMMGSSIVPMYAYPLSKQHYGLGYGIASSFSNLSLFVCPLVAGEIIDNHGYVAVQLFYMASLIVGMFCITLVWILDKRSNGFLSMTPQQRIAHEQRHSKSRKEDDI